MPRYVSVPVTCQACDEIHAVYVDIGKVNQNRWVEFTCPNANKRVVVLGYPAVARELVPVPPANAIIGEAIDP